MKALARFTAILFLVSCALVPEKLPYETQAVSPAAETDPMRGRGDRADDPAIWVHTAEPGRSLILGTNKAQGLYVYTLTGSEIQRLPVGPVNNVDVRGTLAVASNDGVNALSWFRIDPGLYMAPVSHLGDTPVERTEPYGVCLGHVAGARRWQPSPIRTGRSRSGRLPSATTCLRTSA